MSEDRRGLFGISVAAEMVRMQVQNLRVYERRGLIEPARTQGGTRLYSHDDISRLHRIRDLLAEGLNLAGIGRVLALEEENRRLRDENATLRADVASAPTDRPVPRPGPAVPRRSAPAGRSRPPATAAEPPRPGRRSG